MHNISWVLVSLSSESKPNVKDLHCGILGVGRNSTQRSLPVQPCPFLSHSERSFVELKFLLDSIKDMTWVSCCCLYCRDWTWFQDSRKPRVTSQKLIVLFPSSFRNLKMFYPLGSPAGGFILTSGHSLWPPLLSSGVGSFSVRPAWCIPCFLMQLYLIPLYTKYFESY